jgi:hypothetical protein
MESAPALKFCPCCNIPKEGEAFSPDRRNKDGLNYRCKSCQATHVRNRYRITPHIFLNTMKKYRESLRDYQA